MSIWLKQEEENGFIKVFFKPDFFDFSNTNYKNGLPMFFTLFNINEKEKVEDLIVIFDKMMKEGFKGLALRAKENSSREKARKRAKSKKETEIKILKNYVTSYNTDAIITDFYSPNEEMTKLMCCFRFLHPFTDLSTEEFGFGFSLFLTLEQNETEKIKNTAIELNMLLLDVFEKYIELKYNKKQYK